MLITIKNTSLLFSSFYGALLLLLIASTGKADTVHPGKVLYQRCAACHLASGQGVAGMFPPLAGHLGVLTGTQVGRDYLVMVVELGLMGAIQVGNARYQGVMPAQGPGLDDKETALVLNYIVEALNKETLSKDWQPFTSIEITEIKLRYPNSSVGDIHNLRQQAFTAKGEKDNAK